MLSQSACEPEHDDVASYEKTGVYFGAVIGRVANRISDASFTPGFGLRNTPPRL